MDLMPTAVTMPSPGICTHTHTHTQEVRVRVYSYVCVIASAEAGLSVVGSELSCAGLCMRQRQMYLPSGISLLKWVRVQIALMSIGEQQMHRTETQ